MVDFETPTVRSDPRFANVVAAPALEDRSRTILLCVDPATIRQILATGDREADRYAEYEGLVHGGIQGGTAGLMNAVALFRGLLRPMTVSGQDAHMLAYVQNPVQSYTYPVPHRIGMDEPTRVPAYPNSVFVAYADISDHAREHAGSVIGSAAAEFEAPAAGLVTGWEWVLKSPDDGTMPDNHETRYLERVW